MNRTYKESVGWPRTEFPPSVFAHTARATTFQASSQTLTETEYGHLRGKRVGLVVLSSYPFDPRPRRTADILLRHGMCVDYICVADGKAPWREKRRGMSIFRVPIKRRRGGKFAYGYEYLAFTMASAAVLAARSLRRRYDLVYINNMPDILVASALFPKLWGGAKVILDSHDPMPELMATIFAIDPDSRSVRFIRQLEKWSMRCADRILTPNIACRRLFAGRSCPEEKISVVMNSPDESIFPFYPASLRKAVNRSPDHPFTVMYHGTLLERNGVDLALEAFARVLRRMPTARLHIYGKTTPYFEKVMQSIQKRGLESNVLYLGPKSLEEIVNAIEDCDVGVIPNRSNLFTTINTPTRIFEYLTLGKPVIAPRTPGIQDYFDEGSLIFFEAGNVEELAERIEFVACHPREALSIAERGQQVYMAHSWNKESCTLAQVVGKLLRPEVVQ